MKNKENDLFKFVNSKKQRDKVMYSIHRDMDTAYYKRIKTIESERNKLSKPRTAEIARIANNRWEKQVDGKLMINHTEGKIRVNNSECLFSSIKGAELNVMMGYRVITTEHSDSESKKHASLGGAVVGGLILGPIGAVAGGIALGKTKKQTSGTTVSYKIQTCTHLGVFVNLDSFSSEIVLISNQVDQSSYTYTKAQSDAQKIISMLGTLSRIDVPTSFLRPEEEASVRNIDAQIERKQQELEVAIADKPSYNIPKRYRTDEQSEMSDEEYLQYLKYKDAQRASERETNEASFKQEQDRRKFTEKHKKVGESEIKSHVGLYNIANADYVGKVKVVGSVIYKIIFWFISVFLVVISLVVFANVGGELSGLFFLLTGVLINPLVNDFINKRLFEFPRWTVIIVLFVGFFAAILLF